jgi:hypothetical protein
VCRDGEYVGAEAFDECLEGFADGRGGWILALGCDSEGFSIVFVGVAELLEE